MPDIRNISVSSIYCGLPSSLSVGSSFHDVNGFVGPFVASYVAQTKQNAFRPVEYQRRYTTNAENRSSRSVKVSSLTKTLELAQEDDVD